LSRQRKTEKARYPALSQEMQMIARRTLCAVHVHVEVPDPDRRVDLMTRLLPYTPLLLALSASSLCGRVIQGNAFQILKGALVRKNKRRVAGRSCPPFANLAEARMGLAIRLSTSFGSGVNCRCRAWRRFWWRFRRGSAPSRQDIIFIYRQWEGLRSRWPQGLGRQGRTWRPGKAQDVGP
jgi:Glutamate-cysteine ligase family 2(GCS2)